MINNHNANIRKKKLQNKSKKELQIYTIENMHNDFYLHPRPNGILKETK